MTSGFDTRVVEMVDGAVVLVAQRGVVTESGELLFPFPASVTPAVLDAFASVIAEADLGSIRDACLAMRVAAAKASPETSGDAVPDLPPGFGSRADVQRIQGMVANVRHIQDFAARGLRQGETFVDTGFVEPLSTLVYSLAKRFPAPSKSDKPEGFIEHAAIMTILVMPPDRPPTGPEIHLSALTLSMTPDRLVAHTLRPEVADLVRRTRLRSLPDGPPRLCRRAAIVEVAGPKTERLFGDTACLAFYEHEGLYVLLGLDWPSGFRISSWKPTWAGGDVEDDVAVDLDSELTWIHGRDREEHRAWTKDAVRFLVVTGLLLDAVEAPVGVSDQSSRAADPKGKGKTKAPSGRKTPAWVTRYVSLTPGARAALRDPASTASSVASCVDGRVAQEDTRVAGHLKRVRSGPGGAERKWVWIAAYGARRWVSPSPVKVVVKP